MKLTRGRPSTIMELIDLNTPPDETLLRLYGTARLDAARSRCRGVMENFAQVFGSPPQALFSAPGRTELGGNHTDHQRGCVLAAAVDLDLLAAVSPNESGVLRVQSQGYDPIEVDLRDLAPIPQETGTSAALIRGVAARMSALGCSLDHAGMDAYLVSDVPGGSGLSSSAAFEVLIGTILNDLFWDGHCTPVELAQIGQYAENVYFGKPCGLMDQAACSIGGVVAMDFQNPQAPVVRQIALDLQAAGYALCILDSGADHADLTREYAAITEELRSVSAHFGKEVLREVPESDFLAALPALRTECGDRAVLRATHFYRENARAAAQADTLEQGEFPAFLQLVRDSGISSALYLQNVIPTGQVQKQELMVALSLCEGLLHGTGAVRVHGGGFGGTIQAFVPLDRLDLFRIGAEAVLGKGSCHVLSIRPVGGIRLI